MMYLPSMVVPLLGSIHSSAVPVTTSQHSPPTPQITPQGPGSAGVVRPSAPVGVPATGSGPMDARCRNSLAGVYEGTGSGGQRPGASGTRHGASGAGAGVPSRAMVPKAWGS